MKGLRIGITSARKGRELADALARRGATPVLGPTLAELPPGSDAELLAQTDAILGGAPAFVVASTGVGMRAWIAAADASGRGERLRALLAVTPSVARGPKAIAGLRAVGSEPVFVSPQETDADVAAWLAARLPDCAAVAVQVHGSDTGAAYGALERHGAQILYAVAYRCVVPTDLEPARRLIQQAVAGHLDVLAATSAPAVHNLFAIAAGMGCRDALVAAFDQVTAAAAVGPVTAEAFEDEGVRVEVMPHRFRTADLIRAIERWHARRDPGSRAPEAAALRLVPDARVVRFGSDAAVLGRTEFAVLAALVRRPELVCRPDQLAREAWGHRAEADGAQVKHHIARIRRKLGPAGEAIETVRGVGYRYNPGTASHPPPHPNASAQAPP